MSGLHEAFDAIVADVPAYGDLDRAIDQAGRERHQRHGVVAGLVAAAAVVAVIVGVLAVTRGADDARPPVGPSSPSPTEKRTAIDPVVPTGPSDVVAARQFGRDRLAVGGEILAGKWILGESRHDVWTGAFIDDVGYSSGALWWGKGTTTHEVPGTTGGVAISQDARWIVWTRPVSGEYQDTLGPRIMEVVDTATGEVRWTRAADADAPDIGALAVTNDGVVVFAHCLGPYADPSGWTRCDGVRLDAWAPRTGVTTIVSTELDEVLVTGAHNGFLLRDAAPGRTPSVRPEYVRVSEHGDVEAVATLPRSTTAVTADERFALLCDDSEPLCEWSVLALDGGEPRPIPSLAELLSLGTDYEWNVNPFIVERADLLVVRDLGAYDKGGHQIFPAVARCSLAQARCVRITD